MFARKEKGAPEPPWAGDRWEYKSIAMGTEVGREHTRKFNELGQQGWELVFIVHDFGVWAHFKRRIPAC